MSSAREVSGSARYSVLVVTWQSAGVLAGLVQSMNRFLGVVDAPELIVVDNASTDAPADVAAQWRGPRRFIALGENRGFGAANNLGVKEATGDAVVLLNPDVELIDDSLGRLAALARTTRALVGPRILNPDRSVQPSASGPPAGVWPWVGAFVPGAAQPQRVRRMTEPWRLEERSRVSWLTGACVAASRELLLELGPFDPSLHLYSEDLDLGLRAAQHGVPSLFAPDTCRVVHLGDASSGRRFSDRGQALAARNRRVVLRRIYGDRGERNAWLAELARQASRTLVKRAIGRDAGRNREALAAHWRARHAAGADAGVAAAARASGSDFLWK